MRSAVIQESSGSLRVTIPADVANELDLDGGDAVFVRAITDDEFAVRAAASMQWRSD
jgi:AbrB family looped-hinge helix DNA binding protein